MHGSDTDVAPVEARMPAGGPRRVQPSHATRPRALNDNPQSGPNFISQEPGLPPAIRSPEQSSSTPKRRANPFDKLRAAGPFDRLRAGCLQFPLADDTVFSPARHDVSTAIVPALRGGDRVRMTALRTKASGAGASFRLPTLLALGIAMALAFIARPPSAHAACPAFELPPLSLQATNPAQFRANDGAPASYYLVNLMNVPAGYSVTNGNYLAWCIDYFAPLPIETFLNAVLRDSTAPLPSHLQSTNWDMVNYILNHKQGGAFDVQGAIWHFIGGPVPINDPAFFPPSVATLLMIQDAIEHGDGYLPTGPGTVVAVVLDAGPAIQLLILEGHAPFSRPPVANPDGFNTLKNTPLSTNASAFLANDQSPNGTALHLIEVSSNSTHGGTVTLSGLTVTYTPPAGFTGLDTFTYVITDGVCDNASTTVTISVTPRPNQVPIANADTVTTLRDQPLVIPGVFLTSNDTDPDGDPLVIAAVSTNSAHGGLVMIVGTNVVYTPAAGFVGVDTFTYTIDDGFGGTATATVTVTVIRPNAAPTPMNDTASTLRDQPLNIPAGQLLANDTDPDGDPLVILGVSTNSAQGGIVVLIGTNVVYTPPPGFVGVDTFTYTVSDGAGGTATATVTVTVIRPNAAPVAMNDIAATERNVMLTLPIAMLLANDSDPDNDALTLLTVDLSTAQHGAVMLEGTNVVYFPPLNFVGADMFSYSIGDGHGGNASAVVTVNVTRPNAAPTPMNDNVAVLQDHPLVIPVGQLLANDSDADGDILTIIGVSTNSAHGGIVVLIGTNVVYTPPAGFVGVDTFTYTVSDGQGGTATATVTVTVTRANRDPVAANDSASTTQNVALQLSVATLLANDTDADGDPLTVIGIDMATAQLGSTLLSGTNITYFPPLNFIGQDTFTYTISDGHGGTSTGTVQITVSPVNHPPMAGNFAFTTLRDTPINLGLLFLLSLASDPDGDTVQFDHAVPVSQAGGHTLLSLLTNGLLRYTPPAGFTGSDSFNYVVNDGRGLSATGTVLITVLDSPMGMIEEAAIYNPQTGLFEQRVTVSNESSNTIAALRIFISNLRTNIRVWNAAGVLNGTNYVQYNRPLNPGQSATFRVEYYVPDRRPFTPVLRSEETLPVPQPSAQGGTGVAIDHSYLDTRVPGEPRLFIEFTSTPGRIYTIIYSDDMKSWKAATPSVPATANRTQWYDDGPPKTDAKPAGLGSRFYRVIQAP